MRKTRAAKAFKLISDVLISSEQLNIRPLLFAVDVGADKKNRECLHELDTAN